MKKGLEVVFEEFRTRAADSYAKAIADAEKAYPKGKKIVYDGADRVIRGVYHLDDIRSGGGGIENAIQVILETDTIDPGSELAYLDKMEY
jgi:hypothetical protein